MFEAFSVDPRLEQLYRTLLELPEATTDELGPLWEHDTLGLDEGLAQLSALGLVTHLEGAGPRAVPPEQAVAILVTREEEALEARRQQLQQSRESIPELVDAFVSARRRKAGEDVELLPEPALVRSRLFQLTAAAKRSVWSLHPGPGLQPAAIAAALPLERELSDRGLDCRLVVTTASLDSAPWLDYLAELEQLGQAVRTVWSLSQRTIVFDGEHAVIPYGDADRPGAYVLHGEWLAAPLVNLFEEIWSQGEPLPSERPPVRGEVGDARMREVAALLALGIKDEAVARRLGVSVRTVRRLIAATMAELQASSRFLGGVNAVRRGWIDGGPLSDG